MKRKRKTKKPAGVSASMFGGYDAAVPSPLRQLRFWPSVDARREVDAWDLRVMWGQARSLAANMPEVGMLFNAMVDLMGWLEPMPATDDLEWNEAARRVFRQRAEAAGLLDLSGRMTWQSCQEWVERRALIDGDCLVVLSRGADGGARFAFYEAPQLALKVEGRYTQPGVITNAASRVLYYVLAGEKKPVYVPAYAGFLYSHQKDPARVRSVSELAAAINNASDLQDVQTYTKAGIKFAASYAVVETKDPAAVKAEMQSAWREARAGGGGSAAAGAGDAAGGAAGAAAGGPALPGWNIAPRLDSQVVSLAPGRKLDVIHDTRPSNETSGFMERLVSTLAYSLGLDPAVVFFPERLGSASARFTLKKMQRTIRRRLRQRAELMQFMWNHIIACEVAAGRLRPCTAENADAVRWVPQADLTIDAGREIAGTINAVREGLADADAWTMSTAGKTQREILRDRAENIRYAQDLAAELGVPLSVLLPGALGATTPPAAEPASVEEAAPAEPVKAADE